MQKKIKALKSKDQIENYLLKNNLSIQPKKRVKNITFILQGRCIPKPRPRLSNSSHSVHLPKNYVQWKKKAILSIRHQFLKYKNVKLIGICNIEFTFIGLFRGDPDNCAGSYLDALVQAKILKNDTLNIIRQVNIQYHKDSLISPVAIIKIYY